MKERLIKLESFLRKDVWRVDASIMSPWRKRFLKLLKVVILALSGFEKNKCGIRASSLTFYSVLSIVPVLALAFGVAQGFGLEEILRKQIIENFQGQDEVITYLLNFSHTMLKTAKGGMIAGIGVVLLIWSVMKLLNNIEESFNNTWEIRKPRSYLRKFTDYLTIMIISPIFIILAGSVTIFLTTMLKAVIQQNDVLKAVSPVLFTLLKFLPYILIWIVLIMVYIIMPNTRVRVKAAIFAGIVAGSLYQIVQWAYITFQIGAANYSAVYGSFAALPLFLIWLQMSWMIVLLGAEMAYAVQNYERYGINQRMSQISIAFHRKLALLVSNIVIKRFTTGEPALTTEEISKHLKIPVSFTKSIVNDLVECKLFSPVRTGKENQYAYQPALDINVITVKFVIDKLEEQGLDDIPINSDNYQAIKQIVENINQNMANMPENKLLKDI